MSEKGKNISKQASAGFSFRSFISGEFLTNSFLTKNIWFILFIVGLIMLTMYNKFLTEKVINNINKTKLEVNNLKAISVSNTAELMHLSKESVVIKMVEEQGLKIKPLKRPPEKIVIKEERK
jgi:hypothetical protein